MQTSIPFVSKVSSWLDKEGNHIEMGLHVFFGSAVEVYQLLRDAIFYLRKYVILGVVEMATVFCVLGALA